MKSFLKYLRLSIMHLLCLPVNLWGWLVLVVVRLAWGAEWRFLDGGVLAVRLRDDSWLQKK